MQSKAKPFDASAFTDQYQDAFFEIVKAKIEGEEPVIVEEEESPRTFNFIEALKQSVAEVEKTGGKKVKPAKKPAKKAASKKKPPAKSVTAGKKRARKTG